MKKVAIAILVLLLLTGCWDRMPLRNINMVDITGLDMDEKSGDFVLDFVVTTLKKAGQGQGEPISEITELKGPSIVEAVGKGEYIDQGRFLAINTRMYLMGERLASQDSYKEIDFVLHAPYTSINAPIVVFEGDISKLLKQQTGTKKPLTKKLNDFIKSLETNGVMYNVSIMNFVLSHLDPLEDVALPLLRKYESRLELSGALLFHQGTSTGVKLSQEQIQMMMMLKGKTKGRQRITGHLPGSVVGKSKDIDYGFSVRNVNSKIIVSPESGELPSISMRVRLQINAFELGKEEHSLKAAYVNEMEKELNKHLEEKAAETIDLLQKANCDVLGIGKQIKAYHPSLWKNLDWRQDYPRLSIQPKFDVKILNSDSK